MEIRMGICEYWFIAEASKGVDAGNVTRDTHGGARGKGLSSPTLTTSAMVALGTNSGSLSVGISIK